MSDVENKQRAFQIYWDNIQRQVPSEMWGFMGFFLSLDYLHGAFDRNVPVDMVVDKIKYEYSKHISARMN